MPSKGRGIGLPTADRRTCDVGGLALTLGLCSGFTSETHDLHSSAGGYGPLTLSRFSSSRLNGADADVVQGHVPLCTIVAPFEHGFGVWLTAQHGVIYAGADLKWATLMSFYLL